LITSREWDFFFLIAASRPGLGLIQPSIQWVPWLLSPRVKQLACEADISPPSSAEVKSACMHASTLPVCPHGVVLN